MAGKGKAYFKTLDSTGLVEFIQQGVRRILSMPARLKTFVASSWLVCAHSEPW
jgi:hypothetical protein